MVPTLPGEPDWLRLRGPNKWPVALPELRPVLLEWHASIERVLGKLLHAFALMLEQPRDALDYLRLPFPNNLLKVIRYPGRPGDGAAERQGVGPHKDGGILTAVLQHKISGLEVETEEGWVSAPPIPGTFVVNIGELLELASDGYLKATVHRVTSPPAGTERLSLAYFLRWSLRGRGAPAHPARAPRQGRVRT